MSETRKLTTILAADVAGYSRLAAADEERTLARLRALRGDLIDPAVSLHHGRVVKWTGDGILVEFRSPVEAVRCAIEVQTEMAKRNSGLPSEKRIDFRVGIHLGDVVEEADGDLMGDGVNIAARLEGISEPGAIYLSRATHEQVDGKIAERLIDLGDKELKNIGRKVRVFAIEQSTDRRESIIALAPSSAPRLSIVVLPFANIGGDSEREYFVDGVTESLTTDLSRIAGAFVIARNTAFTYKGRLVDVTQIGRDLNVRYVLQGSVQRSGDRLRVNVQFIDAQTGNHLWAERFDKPLADLFDMQDEIVTRLARALHVALIDAEARRAARVQNPDSVDLTFRGGAAMNKGLSSKNIAEARKFYDRAVALDPNNVEALTGLAWCHGRLVSGFLSDDRAASIDAASKFASEALRLRPTAQGYMVLGFVNAWTQRQDRAVGYFESALELNPNEIHAHLGMGGAKLFSGHAEDVEPHIRKALRLSPRDSERPIWYFSIGASKLYLDKFEESIGWLNSAIRTNPSFAISYFYLAAALAHLGRLEEAREAVKSGLDQNKDFTIARLRENAFSNNQDYLTRRERIYEGMRMAGVPEG